jgi:hypothetical protein
MRALGGRMTLLIHGAQSFELTIYRPFFAQEAVKIIFKLNLKY